jgi:hypothetical protein
MTWIQLDDRFYLNDKITKLSVNSRWLYISGLCYSSLNLTDGFLSFDTVKLFECQESAPELVTAKLWLMGKKGYKVAKYTTYQTSKREVEAKKQATRERVAKFRENASNANGNALQGCYKKNGNADVTEPENREQSTELSTTSTISSRRGESVDNFSPLCELLADGVWGNLKAISKTPEKVKRPKVTKAWLDSMRLLVTSDGHEGGEVHDVITWVLDDEFWKSNIMSPSKLRIQFDQLLLKKPVGPRKPRSLEHAKIVDPKTQEPYCQSCGQSWPCLHESKKGEAKF